ncbi:MAG TPA: HsdR family type I site-specific deoxyribonuclease [Crocinitomicaceae bacterium]|nr:HsdR family type I site-specific deoxyribonuclease [Crocinitomicaceae bacterium]
MTLQPEDIVHKEIKDRLIEIGWKDGNSELKIPEHTLIEHYYLPEILEKKIVEINGEEFSKLREEEKREVIEKIFNELNSREERILYYLKYGVKIKVGKEIFTFNLIDHQKPKRNYFFFLHEAKFKGSPDNSKPDFTLFINGIPIVIIEAKPESVPFSHKQALKDIRSYEMRSPDLFRFVQFAVAYGDEKRYTPTLPNWERKEIQSFSFNWKDDIFDLLRPSRLVEFIKYFVFFWNPEEGVRRKLIARWNQYRATKRAMKRIDEHIKGGKNKGLIWHWQGSGKTFTMFFIANYFLDRYYSQNPVVFFVVDRQDLERQLDEVLKSIQEEKFRSLYRKIESISELCRVIETLKESEFSKNIIPRGVYLTTIQKFQRGQSDFVGLSEKEDQEATQRIYSLLHKLAERYLKHLEKSDPEEYRKAIEKLSSLKGKDKEKYILELGGVKSKFVLFLIDEAHRSHYNTLGAMRKASFPNCITFGFTGTPIFKHERNTFLEFSYPQEKEYYLDVYFIGESIRDGFTLPIVYEVIKEGDIKAEGIQIKLTEREIADFIKEYMKKRGEIDKLLEAKITKKDIRDNITKAKVILLNPERIDKLAKYIVNRIEEDTENFKFKAMVVAVNRLACVRYKKALDKYLVEKFGEEARKWAEIVMTYNYKETEKEILEYMEELRKRRGNKDYNEINREIQDEFKNKDDPKILIVTDMLLTGFDAPRLRVMYLDKPLYEHRLLQAIARVNRPYDDKEYGLIVDSIGLMEHLTKTMAIYNLLADEDAMIRQDLELNLMSSIEQKFSEFELRFNKLKEELKMLKVGEEEVGIDLDAVKNALKTGEGKEELQAKIKMLAMLHTEDINLSARLVKLVNEMRSILRLYKALGAYTQKIVYIDDIQALAYIYYKLRAIIFPRTAKLGKDFWNELRSYIYQKTIVEEFKEIGKTKLEPEKIEKLASDFAEKFGEEELRRKIINQLADYFFYIRNFVREKMHDPVYRQIAEKIERLRIEWIMRVVNTKTFLAKLRAIEDEMKEYRKKIEGKSLEERLKESMSYYVKQRTNKNVDFTSAEKYLKNLVSRKIKILPGHERELKTRILEDLFLAGVKENEAVKLTDELVDYIKEELERIWNEKK